MGKEFVSPDGERLIFRKTAAETNGELLEMEAIYNPIGRLLGYQARYEQYSRGTDEGRRTTTSQRCS